MAVPIKIAFTRRLPLLALLLSTLGATDLWATHNRAGEITYQQIGELTIRVTITTYTKTSSIQADRDSLELFWGDGTSTVLPRANGNGDELDNDIKRNFYIGEHTYPGRATYVLSMTDPNRIANIQNVNFPNSVKIPFHIATSFTFLSSQFQGQNSSAILLQPPIDFGCIGRRYVHNANAYDPDGDSLSYELIVPLQDNEAVVPNYLFPDQIVSGPNNQLTLDPVTGDLVWDAPQKLGDYNVAFLIHEYRQGVLINTIIRDMQIEIRDCENTPPAIDVDQEICVIAGEEINLEVLARDRDLPQQQLSLTAIGGPLAVDVSPATFSISRAFRDQPVAGTLRWQTQCEHISDQPYSVVFKAVDNFYDSTGLADLKTVRIKVVGPPLEDLKVSNEGPVNTVSWEKPYACEVTENEFFRGFTVWRRMTSNPFVVDTCDPGLEGKGYEAIAFSVKDMEGGRYVYEDRDIPIGKSFCYRVTASFARLSSGGYPFNVAESLASNEDCAGFSTETPFMTKVSVVTTDVAAGEMQVEWIKPTSEDLDQLPGPFTFQLLRGTGLNPGSLTPIPAASFTASSLAELLDTSFFDNTGLNTLEQAYTYQVRLTNGSGLNVSSDPTSSVFLTVTPADTRNILSLEFAVPWENYQYIIYRQNASGLFEAIGTSLTTTYVDEGLTNGQRYCYYVEAHGTYGFSGIADPLINLSQVACGVPEDTDPPCTPALTVMNSCGTDTDVSSASFVNTLEWSFDGAECDQPDDVAGFRIYYSPTPGADFTLLEDINDAGIRNYRHDSDVGIAGCYYITALDSLANESDTSNNVCVENCPFYTLPNAFTPNDDGHNDVFKPYPYKFIDRVQMTIYNRWGQVVFETTDPDINWTGQNMANKDLSQGVYHYTCRLFESKAQGVVENPNELRGFIELVR